MFDSRSLILIAACALVVTTGAAASVPSALSLRFEFKDDLQRTIATTARVEQSQSRRDQAGRHFTFETLFCAGRSQYWAETCSESYAARASFRDMHLGVLRLVRVRSGVLQNETALCLGLFSEWHCS